MANKFEILFAEAGNTCIHDPAISISLKDLKRQADIISTLLANAEERKAVGYVYIQKHLPIDDRDQLEGLANMLDKLVLKIQEQEEE